MLCMAKSSDKATLSESFLPFFHLPLLIILQHLLLHHVWVAGGKYQQVSLFFLFLLVCVLVLFVIFHAFVAMESSIIDVESLFLGFA